MSIFFPTSASELCIDLDALVVNWRHLQRVAAPAECAAVVKANAYGLGDVQVTCALAAAGCRVFYVTTIKEAERIAGVAPDDARIFIFNGVAAEDLASCRKQAFIPVLSTPSQVEQWHTANRREGRVLPCSIQVDTGMNRLGLEISEWRQLRETIAAPDLGAAWIMSHLACAEEAASPMNGAQLARFKSVLAEALQWAPGIRASFANSGGVLLGPEYHFQQVRPGIALYGGYPESGDQRRFKPVVHLRLPILQLRRVSAEGTVGYGALAKVPAGALLATVQGGYADGLMVSQWASASGEVAGHRVPMIGRISMDLTIFDVSALPPALWRGTEPPAFIEVLNSSLTVDHMAQSAGTISYEILTRLGSRWRREYRGGQAAAAGDNPVGQSPNTGNNHES